MSFIYWVIVVVIIIGIVSFLLYKSGFRLTELKFKLGIGEAKMERTPEGETKEAEESDRAVPSQMQFLQEASDGAAIKDATIKAPADSDATAHQLAKGKGSKLNNTHIELD